MGRNEDSYLLSQYSGNRSKMTSFRMHGWRNETMSPFLNRMRGRRRRRGGRDRRMRKENKEKMEGKEHQGTEHTEAALCQLGY